MIPIFPKYKKLELQDKPEVEAITGKFLPYSDFNFTSMYSWDTDESMRISQLNTNLVVRFSDYITGEPFYSFIGETDVDKTAETLLTHAKNEQLCLELRLVPEITKSLLSDKFHSIEDRDNFDYIYDLQILSQLPGVAFIKKRHYIHRFQREYPDVQLRLLDLSNLATQTDINNLFSLWTTESKKSSEDTASEQRAIQRCFLLASETKLITEGYFIKDKFIGFGIDEILLNNNAISHFEKGDKTYKYIFEYMKQHMATTLKDMGAMHLNMEQDLGISGLRDSKEQWRPTGYLKKYTITLR